MILEILSICVGASLGALLRWLLGNSLNSLLPLIPPGTLLANLAGAFLIGLAMPFFATFTTFSPNLRLFFITGFLGALTTFSTFTAEMGSLLEKGKIVPSLAGILLHVGGSLTLFFIGMGCFYWIKEILHR